MGKGKLFYNTKIYTQAENLVVDSMAVYKNKIVAIGNNLQHDPDLEKYKKINMRGKTIIPGFVDSHTHFYFFALSFGRVELDGVDSIEKCLSKIKKHADSLKKNEWVVGEGYSTDRFKKIVEPDKFMLDKITDGRPALIYSKDQHSVWVNSKALKLGGISDKTKDPSGGKIERLKNGEPSGILREGSAYNQIYNLIPEPSFTKTKQLYKQALEFAYKNGVTSVHSFDGPKSFEFFEKMAESKKLGLRINYYFPSVSLPLLKENKIFFGAGDDFLRLAGIKIFADGALGSQSALCFNKYIGSKDNYGLEVASVKTMARQIKAAAKLGFPSAIHAIGDKAISNVLDAFEESPQMHFGARHRIEHLQLCRKKDLARLKSMNIVASMQPSHCPSDIDMCRKYWGKRSANAYIIKSVQDKKIDLAFGSDAPIEPLKPIEGIAAAVRRARPNSHDTFHPEQKITAADALYHYTVGAAKAVGQDHCRGYLLPGYPADFVVLSDDITKIAPSKIYDVKVKATVIDGEVMYSNIAI